MRRPKFLTITCEIEGCERKHKSRGYCGPHYRKFLKYGDPFHCRMIPPVVPILWMHLQTKLETEECVHWPFLRRPDGYPVFGSQRGKRFRAHRYMCELVHGSAPTDMHQAAHSCGNGHLGCVNPKHLRWATPKENIADQKIHGTYRAGSKIEHKAILNEGIVADIKQRLANGDRNVDIANVYDISPHHVSAIKIGKSWKHV